MIYRNYLRIYANFGKTEYNTTEKELLVNTFIRIAEEISDKKDLRYDIIGEGYGISKSRPYIMSKTFWDKLEKKGLENLNGIHIISKKSSFHTLFQLLLQAHNFYRFDCDFFWDFDTHFDHKKATEIINILSPLMKINYAYGYIADETVDLSECTQEKDTRGIYCYLSDEQEKWEEKLGNIEQGEIKKIYPFNVFNSSQITKLKAQENEVYQKILLKDGLEIWQFSE